MHILSPEEETNRRIEALVKSRFNKPAKVIKRYPMQYMFYQSRTGSTAHTDVSRLTLGLPNNNNTLVDVVQKGTFNDLENIVRETSALTLFSSALDETNKKHIPYYYGRVDNYIIKEFIFGESLDSILSLIQERTKLHRQALQQSEQDETKQQITKKLSFLETNYRNYLDAAFNLATLLHSSSQDYLLRNPTAHWLQLKPDNVVNDLRKYLSNLISSDSTEEPKEIDEICNLFSLMPVPYEMCYSTNMPSLIVGDFRQANVLVSQSSEDRNEFMERLESEIINPEEIFEYTRITDFDRSHIANQNIDIVDILENPNLVVYDNQNLFDSLLESLVSYRRSRKRSTIEIGDIKRDLLNFAPIRLIRGASSSKENRTSYLQIALNLMERQQGYQEIRKKLGKLLTKSYPNIQINL